MGLEDRILSDEAELIEETLVAQGAEKIDQEWLASELTTNDELEW